MEPCICTPISYYANGSFLYSRKILQTSKITKNNVPISKKVYRKGKCQMVKVTLKDGSKIEVEQGATILEVAKKISEGLARVATCGEIDGEIKDLRYEIKKDCNLVIHTFNEEDLDGKKAYWHTTSHIMAQAVQRIFPDVKFAIGPSINEGFYYDFDVEKPFTDEDKAKIEE